MKSKSKGKGNKKLATFSFFSILIFVIGIVIAILYATLPFFKAEENALFALIFMWAAVGITLVGVILVLICIGLYRREDKRLKELEAKAVEKLLEETEKKEEEEDKGLFGLSTQALPELGNNVTYIPSMEAYESINMGQYQSLEEKFNQISKMDRTQFVIYVARLFSRKGYQVKLTPVVDNHDIDLLVEKMGVTIAVGCLISSRILCKEDIVCVKNGRSYYGVNNSMALTNMYFDRTALDYAKAEHMSLVDRNILAEDFMN